MRAFNHCAEGHTAHNVLNAAAQMTAASIGFCVRESGGDADDLEAYAEHICEIIVQTVRDNWQRKSLPDDIEVKLT